MGITQRPLYGDSGVRKTLLSCFVALIAEALVSTPTEAVGPSLDDAVRSAVKEDTAPSFSHALIDLNGDGQLDAVVLLRGSMWCGSGGCTLLIFRGTANGFALLSKSTIAREPVEVLPAVTHGWRTLIVNTGGIGPVVMSFNGSRYPGNPSTQPKATPEQIKTGQRLNFTK